MVLITLLLGSAGVNGLTNYLDRDVDARMQRTKHRVLPAKRIEPPEKVLPLTIGLVIVGLVLAWQLHPLSFVSSERTHQPRWPIGLTVQRQQVSVPDAYR